MILSGWPQITTTNCRALRGSTHLFVLDFVKKPRDSYGYPYVASQVHYTNNATLVALFVSSFLINPKNLNEYNLYLFMPSHFLVNKKSPSEIFLGRA
jgi:hypothetical protein